MASTHKPVQLSIHTKVPDGAATPLPLSVAQGLTPPVTPTIEDGSVSESVATLPSSTGSSTILSPVEANSKEICPNNQPAAALSPPQFSDVLEYQRDSRGRPVEFGRGAWSIVYQAFASASVSSSSTTNAPAEKGRNSSITPPNSPSPARRVMAVKSPARRDAHAIIHAEALALAKASRFPGSERHIVPFHGYIAESNSFVMSAVPLALSTYIQDKARIAHQNKSTKTMFDPVQGMAQWHDLAKKLVAGLTWLHSEPQILHGDIKPHNILLQPRSSADDDDDSNATTFPYEPLFADFSSSYPISATLSSQKPQGAALTALTPPFAAPELLCVSSLTSPDVAPTPASDIFSLAVTMLAAATGDLLLYPGYSQMQRLAMAREGHRVIEFARSGTNGSRVPRNGIVEQIIKPAVLKDPAQRIIPKDWVRLTESVA